MTFYDHEREPWDWECDTDTVDWPWPSWPSIFEGKVYEACPLGCEYGAARWGEGFWFECPGCGGSGLGEEHSC